MNKILGVRKAIDVTLAVLLIGGLALSFGFGCCLYIARQEVMRETDYKMQRDIAYIQSYVDGELKRVEDAGYTLLSSKFGKTERQANGYGFVVINQKNFKIPSEEEVFDILNTFLDANPHICGVAIGFEPFLYKETKGEYGFAAYVTNVSGKNENISLGEIHDFREKEWYKQAAAQNKPYWSKAFRETLKGKVVTCFSLPLHGLGNRLIGVLAIDIDTEVFRKECLKISPFPNAEVALVDHEFNLVAHPDTTNILQNVADVVEYKNYTADDSMKANMLDHKSGSFVVNKGELESLFFFAPIKRNGWTVSIECPKDDVYAGVERMKRDTTFIAVLCIIFMVICFIFLFRRFQKMNMVKAGMESELKIASGIQMGMIPKLYPAFPDRDDLDVCGFLKPAKDVGGDLYDYFIRDEKLFFCVGDVSGKGVPASLFMTVIRSLFRNNSLHVNDPAEIVSSLNTALSEGNVHNMFCTLFTGVLDLRTGHLDYCNAGHNAPIVRRIKDGKPNVYYTKPQINLAVGVFEGFPYVKEETQLMPGEAIFMYTDGVTEAENIHKKLFGEEATLKTLAEARAHNMKSAKDFIEYVHQALVKYARGAEQSDDITMLVVEYKGPKK